MYAWFQVKLSFINMEKFVLMVLSKISNHIKKKSKISNAYITMYKKERERENLVLYRPCPFGKKKFLPFDFYRSLFIKHLIEIIFLKKAYYYLFVTHLT